MPFGYKEIPKENVLADFLTEEQLRYNKIMIRLHEHYLESLQYFPEDQTVGCFLQGSQNYGLDHEESDVDTKLIVVPSFKDICLNRKPVSTTHVRANDEHTDWKDIRLYMVCQHQQALCRRVFCKVQQLLSLTQMTFHIA